jgi:hypothetical protein
VAPWRTIAAPVTGRPLESLVIVTTRKPRAWNSRATIRARPKRLVAL